MTLVKSWFSFVYAVNKVVEERVHCYHKSPTKPSLVVMHNTNKVKVEEEEEKKVPHMFQTTMHCLHIHHTACWWAAPSQIPLDFFLSMLPSGIIIYHLIGCFSLQCSFFLSDGLSFSPLLNCNWTSEELINVKISTFSHSKKCWPWMFTRNVSYVLKWCAHWFILLGLKYYIGVWITKNSWFWYWAGRIW